MPPSAVPDFETVTDAGADAPWLTLLHAASQHRRVFAAQVRTFARTFRLLLVDLPGHGRSAHLPGPYGLAEHTAAVGAALDAAGVARTHLWGTHTGAGVGLLLGAGQPQRIASLVLEGPVRPGQPMPSVTTMYARVSAAAREQGLPAARELWWREGPWFAVMRALPAQTRAEAQRALIAEFQGAPWLDATPPRAVALDDAALRALRVPTLIVNGEHDVPDFLATAKQLAALLPRAERASIPGGGGFPLWEWPERVNPLVHAFLVRH